MTRDGKSAVIRVLGVGIATGIGLAILGGAIFYLSLRFPGWKEEIRSSVAGLFDIRLFSRSLVVENFDQPITAAAGKTFGRKDQLTFELFRNGAFEIDGRSGFARQRSPSYRDSAFIRSTVRLPKTYKINVVVGDIDYNLEKIAKLPRDPEYPEGPGNENGCYFITITDIKPEGHHTNIWWHQHRKLVIDVDNNVWGHGMPNPIFMVYFDRSNRLNSFDGQRNEWISDWRKAVTYDPKAWYSITVEKTKTHFILSVADEREKVLKRGKVKLSEVWHEDGYHPDYFVVGDPHENYYQGSMKIRSISFTPT